MMVIVILCTIGGTVSAVSVYMSDAQRNGMVDPSIIPGFSGELP